MASLNRSTGKWRNPVTDNLVTDNGRTDMAAQNTGRLPQELAEPLDQFIEHLRSEKRHSPHTCSNYQRDLTSLACQLDDAGELHWRALDIHGVRRHVADLSRSGLGGRSIARHLSAIRRFYDYLLREGMVSDSPALDVRPPRSGRKLPRVADVDQLNHLLDAEPEDALELRDRAMFELVYSAGLRLAELVGLDLNDLNLEAAEVRVLGKGAKTRVLPVGRAAREALAQWESGAKRA